jgi:hypothetical protein
MRVKKQSWITLAITLLGALAFSGCTGARNFLTSTVELTFPLATASQTSASATKAIETSSVATSTAYIPAFKHIFIIVLENKEEKSIAGSKSAPYLNSLATQYARATNFYGTRHPSLPNYLALTGGDTFGVTSDCKDCFVEADNLASQLETAGRSWKAYMEGMPSPCFVGDAPPLYRQKHNPFIYYDNVRNDPTLCQKIVPFDQFATDLKADTLPDFVWITPNMCHDMHDCAVADGDKWLKTWVPQILASPAWQDNGVLFITFDESKPDVGCCKYATAGKIFTLVISPLVQPGFTSDVPYDHYSLLRTIEMAWHLPLLGKANCDCSPPMSEFFASAKAAFKP